ncbi:LacI family DNA-binding transcriptional regulator [Paenibacillus thalictri]|uniref:LacI family DNA-binding transcriptional regulator n=1 Tax=Paenibacillus thalictri TaxID=2527873 RepID=UPI001F0D4AB0|nr:LacI family DNA-binding transcriptional regulator [Paenibacillus thalictri]
MKDVALIAGVSPATVSRVLTNKGNIASETKARIYSAMEQVNYVPSGQQQAGKSKTVCLAIARTPSDFVGNAFFSDVLCGISDAAKQIEYNVLFSLAYTMEEQIEKCARLYKEKQAGGFIFTSVLSSDKDMLLQKMQELQIPFVLIGKSLTHNVFSVHNDNMRDSYMATTYLINKGYKNILLLTPNVNQDVVHDRIHGYRRAVEEHGLHIASTHVVYCDDDEEGIMRTLERVRQEGIVFDAIMTMENIMSLSALKYCQSKGLRVPEDLGILCFNNAAYLDKLSPSITCVDLNPTLLGAEAFKLLKDIMNAAPADRIHKSVTLPSEIIERNST